MKRIYYQSDLKIVEDWPGTEQFVYHYFTQKSGKRYDVSLEIGNCRRATTSNGKDKLVISLDNHGLEIGQLKVLRELTYTDSDFVDGIFDKKTENWYDVKLVDGESDDDDPIESDGVFNIFRGEVGGFRETERADFMAEVQIIIGDACEAVKEESAGALSAAIENLDAAIAAGDTETLEAAKRYADSIKEEGAGALNAAVEALKTADEAVVEEAKTLDSAILEEAKTYADTKATETLESAGTDAQHKIDTAKTELTSAYQAADANVLSQAKAYTDANKGASEADIAAVKAYADQQDDAVLEAAKAYADEHGGGGGGTVSLEYDGIQSFATVDEYTENKESETGIADGTLVYIDETDELLIHTNKQAYNAKFVVTQYYLDNVMPIIPDVAGITVPDGQVPITLFANHFESLIVNGEEMITGSEADGDAIFVDGTVDTEYIVQYRVKMGAEPGELMFFSLTPLTELLISMHTVDAYSDGDETGYEAIVSMLAGITKALCPTLWKLKLNTTVAPNVSMLGELALAFRIDAFALMMLDDATKMYTDFPDDAYIALTSDEIWGDDASDGSEPSNVGLLSYATLPAAFFTEQLGVDASAVCTPAVTRFDYETVNYEEESV